MITLWSILAFIKSRGVSQTGSSLKSSDIYDVIPCWNVYDSLVVILDLPVNYPLYWESATASFFSFSGAVEALKILLGQKKKKSAEAI